MKPAFKTTALAILVALGVTACNPPKNTTEAAVPTPLNNQGNTGNAQTDTNNTQVDTSNAQADTGNVQADTGNVQADTGNTQDDTGNSQANNSAQEEQARLAKEKEENKWRSGKHSGNVTDPRTVNDYGYPNDASARNSHKILQSLSDYAETLDHIGYADTFTNNPGNNVRAPIFDSSNKGFKLDYYELAKNDLENPQVLGVHKGSIKSAGINGAEATSYNEKHQITAVNYPEKVDYLFINTPYSTYGAVYNQNASILFASSETGVSLENDVLGAQIGSYEVVDGNKTKKIIYNDTVKGNATYKGEVIAVPTYLRGEDGKARDSYIGTPSVDGTVTFNANFGTRAEENYISGTLDSKILGKEVELPQARIDTLAYYFTAGKTLDNYWIPSSVSYSGDVVGKDASGVQGSIRYVVSPELKKADGALSEYNAVFAAEKQPK